MLVWGMIWLCRCFGSCPKGVAVFAANPFCRISMIRIVWRRLCTSGYEPEVQAKYHSYHALVYHAGLKPS